MVGGTQSTGAKESDKRAYLKKEQLNMDMGKVIPLLIDGWRNGSRQGKFHIHSYNSTSS